MQLADALARFVPADPTEARHLAHIRAFVSRHPHPFDRAIVEGHLTASAFVVSEDGERVLLLHHRKLERWLQPGGHADPGEESGEATALREAAEETGLVALEIHPDAPRPLDVDLHRIPARGAEPGHDHLDLRYLVVARDSALVQNIQESNDLRWFTWAELSTLDLDPGLRRGLAKARGFWREKR